jgi:uncharacterized BrkB/YihY/UPF0761 family membrane protein
MSGVNPESKKRPVVVTVVGIIIIIHGILLLFCCVPLSVIGMQLPEFAPESPKNYRLFLYVTTAIGMVGVIYGIFAASSLLMNKSWARLHVMISAGLGAITSLIFLATDYGFFGIQWRLDEEGGAIGFVIGILMYIAYIIFDGLVLFFMSRPNVKEYYGR